MRRLAAFFILALALVFGAVAPSLAVDPAERLADPVLEARARHLSEELRCLVCQNQSIDSSDADLARDLRVLVRERIAAGDSDQAVLDYLVARYGDFVLLKPRFAGAGLVLWILPAALFVLAGGGAFLAWRRRGGGAPGEAGLSDDEERRLSALLADADHRDGGESQPPHKVTQV